MPLFPAARLILLSAVISLFVWPEARLAAEPTGEGAVRAPESRPPVLLWHPGRAAGVGQYEPDRWAVVALDLVNRSDRPVAVTGAMFFSGNPTLQFGRQVWLPEKSRREALVLVRTPGQLVSDTERFDYRTMLFAGDSTGDVVIPAETGERFHRGSLRRRHIGTAMGLIADDERRTLGPRQETAYQAAMAVRVARNEHRYVGLFDDDFLPPSVMALDALDQLVLAGDRLARDSAGLRAVRRWLHDGGRLWIMLDLVDPATVALLLEDAWTCQVVDRVGLNTVELQGVARERNIAAEPREFEEPVDLVRVLPSNVRESFRVRDWPAAFWQRVGRGRVLFTTLGAEAWIEKRPAGWRVPANPTRQSDFAVTEPLRQLAAEFIGPRERPHVDPPVWEPVLVEQIGYRVLPRGTVFGVLGGFCAALTAAGVLLTWRRRLEWLGWLAPVMAIVASAALLVPAGRSRQAVPNTLVVGQVAQVVSGSSDAVIAGLAAAYHQEPTGQPVSGDSSGVIWPEMAGLSGTTRRLLWTDLDRWRWQNLSLPAGVRTAPFHFATKLDRPVAARAWFGPAGLEGRLETGPFSGPADALIATPLRMRLAVELQGDGGFSAAASAVQAPGEFVSAGLLSDEQLRRQRIYSGLFAADATGRAVDEPTLFVWTDALDGGFEFPDVERRTGSAVLRIPLTIERAPPRTRVKIPAPFVSYRAGPAPGEVAYSSTYSNSTGRWQPKSGHAVNWLRFQLPAEVLPMRLAAARLTLHITGPARRIELIGVVDGERVPFARREDPVGTLEFDIDRADLLELDERGGFRVGVAVGVRPDEGAAPAAGSETPDRWRIELLHLAAEGQTQP